MTNRIQYSLEARESITSTMKGVSDAMRATGTAADVSFKQLTAGLNASSRASAALSADLKAQATVLNAQTKAAGDARRALDQLSSSSKTTGDSSRQAASSHASFLATIAGGTIIGNLATKALSELGQAAGDVFGGMLKGAQDTEQFNNAFTRLLGTKPAADSFMAALRQFSLKTPFEFEGAAKGAQQLLNLKISSDAVLPTLTALGDAVAAGGGKTDEFNRAMLAYTQVVARGKVSAQEMNQFSQAGIPAWDLLAEAMGKTRAEAMALSEQGQVSAEQFTQAFQQAATTRYAGAMASQMNSLAGAVSNVTDLIQALGSSVLGPTLKVVEEEINKAVTAVQDPAVQSTLAEWGQNLGKVAAAAVDVGGQIVTMGKQALDALRPVTDLIGGLIGALPAVKAPDLGGGGGANPVAPLVASTKDLNTEIDLSTLKAADYHTEIQAAQDTLSGMKRTQEDQKYALDSQIEGERRKLSILEAQYQIQDRATSIGRLQSKIARDEALAQNIYSGPGQAAKARLIDERQQLEDLLQAQQRAGSKAEIEGRISTLEDTKKVREHAGQLAERTVQDEITGLQRRAKFEADELAERKKRYADDLAAWKKAQDTKAAKDKADNTAADARETAHFALISGNSTAFTKQLDTDVTTQSKALAELHKELDSIAVALGFPDAAAALKDLRYQFALTASFISTHMESAGASLTHLIDGAGVLGLKLRQLAGGTISPEGLASIAKYDKEGAILDAGKSLADANFAAQKHQLDIEFGKVVDVGGPTGRRNLNDQAAPPGTAQSHIAPPTGTVGPIPKATGGGGWGMGSLFGAPDLSIDPTTGQPYTGRAGGGHQRAGEVGWVGERGPELWQPDQGGTVVPMNQLGGGGGVVQVDVTHLCPACLVKTVERVVKQQGPGLLGGMIRGSRHI